MKRPRRNHTAAKAAVCVCAHGTPILERKARRVLVNGFPTGVEVAHAMVQKLKRLAEWQAVELLVAMHVARSCRPICCLEA